MFEFILFPQTRYFYVKQRTLQVQFHMRSRQLAKLQGSTCINVKVAVLCSWICSAGWSYVSVENDRHRPPVLFGAVYLQYGTFNR